MNEGDSDGMRSALLALAPGDKLSPIGEAEVERLRAELTAEEADELLPFFLRVRSIADSSDPAEQKSLMLVELEQTPGKAGDTYRRWLSKARTILANKSAWTFAGGIVTGAFLLAAAAVVFVALGSNRGAGLGARGVAQGISLRAGDIAAGLHKAAGLLRR